jgi:hypothetical protein
MKQGWLLKRLNISKKKEGILRTQPRLPGRRTERFTKASNEANEDEGFKGQEIQNVNYLLLPE